MAHTTSNPKIHEGRNLKRFREMMGVKQDHLAFELGEDCTHKKTSLLKKKQTLDSDILDQVAAILKIPAEAIRNFDEEKAINIISNTFQQFHDQSSGVNLQPTYNVNPIEKWIEALEENKRLHAELLKAKDDQIGDR
jgi:transcriptional regulator with XRE-family HTH domain